jgi:hypothetical protein
MGAYDDYRSSQNSSKASGAKETAGNIISNARNAAKEAEAAAVVGWEQVLSRGGVNSQGYFNDVPAYQQLTANERKSVTLPNGTINSQAMLSILNQKEFQYKNANGLIELNRRGSETGIDAVPMTTSLISEIKTTTSAPVVPVKTASIDTVLFDDETMPIDIMSDLIFEDIGGQELINIARNDIVNGQTISYQPIKNLSSLQQQYNPNNILSLQQTSDKYFANFSIKLDERIPTQGSGPNGEYVYLEEGTGDLIIEVVNMPSSEQVDVEITLDGTIYQAVL